MICDKCKRIFSAGNDNSGLPNGVGFELENGKTIMLCSNCIVNLGKMTTSERKKFFDELGV